MNSLYRKALATPVTPIEGFWGDANAGMAMGYRGARRGATSKGLYRAGLGHGSPEVMFSVGAVDISGEKIKSGIVGFLVDIAHILLIIGGLYLVAGAIWGEPVRR